MGYIEGITHLLIFYWLPTVHPSSCWIFQMGWNRKTMGCKGLFTHLNVRNHWVGRVIFPFKLGTLHLEVNHHSQMLVLFWMMINSLIAGKNYHKMKGSQTNLQTTGGQGPPEIPCFLFLNSHADTESSSTFFFFPVQAPARRLNFLGAAKGRGREKNIP